MKLDFLSFLIRPDILNKMKQSDLSITIYDISKLLIPITLLLIFISYLFSLNMFYTLLLFLLFICFIPSLLTQMYKEKIDFLRFDMMFNYMHNILSIFTMKPVITYALYETIPLLEYEIKQHVIDATNYIMSNNDDLSVYKNAFSIIEDNFLNSRLYSLHRFMLSVEKENSYTYEKSAESLFYDLQSYIQRVNTYKKKLKRRKNELLLFCLASIIASCYFMLIFTSNSLLSKFSENSLYQFVTFLFILLIFLLMLLFNGKIQFNHLIEDMKNKDKNKYIKAFHQYLKNCKKPAISDLLIASLFLISAVLSYIFIKQSILSIGLFICMIYALCSNYLSFKLSEKTLKKHILIEYPIWLRNICLNMHTHTFINALENSITTVDDIMKYYVENLYKEIIKDPTSIKPYYDFLSCFHIDEIKNDMKLLYAISNHSIKQQEKLIQSLLTQNEHMLAVSEQLNNDTNISKITKLGFLPVILFLFHMFINMALLLYYLMNMVNSSLTI